MSAAGMINPLRRLQALDQSVWLDYIERDMLTDGRLAALIADDGVTGLTSNPAIFEQAFRHDPSYVEAGARLAAGGAGPQQIYQTITGEDIRAAADLLRPVYARSAGRDGYVSIEVSPHLADDTAATVAEAQRLWARIARANVMIKVPATRAGVAALRRLIAQGINVNATLLFSVRRYREVAQAYVDGLEDCLAAGGDVAATASVASFFLSRIDTWVDKQLTARGPAMAALRGRAAIACARLAYRHYLGWVAEPRWQKLVQAGARPQRLLWASTSTKDPAYPDTMYVEALIGAGTINTLPPDTLAAYRDHGRPALRIEDGLAAAHDTVASLANAGIDVERVAQELEREGLIKFVQPYDAVIEGLSGQAARRGAPV